MTTESVKLDRAIVRRLRHQSHRTGIPISRLANRILDAALKNGTWINLFSQFKTSDAQAFRTISINRK